MPQLNWVDLLILGVLAIFLVDSLGRPFILEFLDFLSFILAFFISFSYYNLPARFFENRFSLPHGLSLVVGFMTAWFLVESAFFLLVRILPVKWSKIRFKGDRLASLVPAFLRGLIFISLFLVLVGTFPIQPKLKLAIQQSILGSSLQKYTYGLEQPVKNVFGGLTADSLTFLTIEPKTNERVNLGFQTNKFSVDQADEERMMELVNSERGKTGVWDLKFDSSLREIARQHSADMFLRGYFSHYSPEGKTVADRAALAGIDYLVIGENLAYAPNLEAAHRGLMNSPGHRANILSTDYHKVGIGVMDGGVYGKMFTQVFTN